MSIEDDAQEFYTPEPSGIEADAQEFTPSTKLDTKAFLMSGSNLQTPPSSVESLQKAANAVLAGTHRGVTHFTYKIMSLIPSERIRQSVKNVDKMTEDWYQQAKKDSPIGAQAAELIGELGITTPFGGAYGGLMKGASALGRALPTGFQTLGKYGASMAGGAGILAAQEGYRYNPNQPDQPFNTEAASEALNNPAAYLAPALGTKVTGWLEKSKALQEGSEVFPGLLPRDVMKKGPARTALQKFLDSAPALTGLGARARQIESVGPVIQNLIRKISNQPEAMSAKDLIEFAGTKLQSGLQKIKKGETEIWESVAKSKSVTDSDGIKQLFTRAQTIFDKAQLPSYLDTLTENVLKKKILTVEDAKNLQSLIGDGGVAANLAAQKNPLMKGAADDLFKLKDQILDKIGDSLSTQELKQFAGAREYTARKYEIYKEIPQLKAALSSEISANNIIKNLLSNAPKYPKDKVMSKMSQSGQDATKAAWIAKALEEADTGAGDIDLGKFIKATGNSTYAPDLLGNETYSSIKGLNKYLKVINEAKHTGWYPQAALVPALGGAVAAGTAAGGLVGGVAVAASYPAIMYISNHPWLKKAFGALTKKMSKSAYDYMASKIEENLGRGGFLMNQDGSLYHKKEDWR